MDKSLLGVLGAVATATAATPITFLSSSSYSNNEGWKGNKIPILIKSSDIKTKYKEIDCLKEHYELGDTWNETIQQSQPKENPFKDASNIKSCLMVEYYKQEQNQKWKGGFRLVWSTASDKKGVVTVFNSNTIDGKLELDASIYVLEKGSASWEVKYKKEESKSIVTSSEELSKKFPQTGSSTNWEFNPDVQNVCKGNECPWGNITINSTTWNWTKSESGEALTCWSSNYMVWFNTLASDWIHIQTGLSSLKGTWSRSTN